MPPLQAHDQDPDHAHCSPACPLPTPPKTPGLRHVCGHCRHPTGLGVTPGYRRRRHRACDYDREWPPKCETHHLPPSIRDWFLYIHNLSTIDGVICWGERIVVPTELCPACLSALLVGWRPDWFCTSTVSPHLRGDSPWVCSSHLARPAIVHLDRALSLHSGWGL
jgi:hypothetical protein